MSRRCKQTTLADLMNVTWLLEMANLVGFFWPTLQGSNNRVLSCGSHFRDQGSLTVGCLRLPFLRLLTRRGGGGGSTVRVDHILKVEVNVPVEVHRVLGPGKDDYWPMLPA